MDRVRVGVRGRRVVLERVLQFSTVRLLSGCGDTGGGGDAPYLPRCVHCRTPGPSGAW